MCDPTSQVSFSVPGKHLILYDGVCGLCDRLVQFVLRRDLEAVFDFASLQSDTARSLLLRLGHANDMSTFYVIENYRSGAPVLLRKSAAALFVMNALDIGGAWLRFVRLLPQRLLDFAYEFVARYRYKTFEKRDSCLLPSVEFKRRFIDV